MITWQIIFFLRQQIYLNIYLSMKNYIRFTLTLVTEDCSKKNTVGVLVWVCLCWFARNFGGGVGVCGCCSWKGLVVCWWLILVWSGERGGKKSVVGLWV